MGGLGIDEITIGYSSTGAAKYVDELNTAAIVETESIITSGVTNVTNALQAGWQGDACESYLKKYREAAEQLKEKLKEMQEVFQATMAAQEETYHSEDESMSEDISATNIF